MHLVPAPAVRLMKRRVQSRPGARQENRFFVLVSFSLVVKDGTQVFSLRVLPWVLIDEVFMSLVNQPLGRDGFLWKDESIR